MDRGFVRVRQHGCRDGYLMLLVATIPSFRVAKLFRVEADPIPTRSILW